MFPFTSPSIQNMKYQYLYTLLACHQFINEQGIRHGASIIKIYGEESHAELEGPFDYCERAFIKWMGGTIIFSTEKEPPIQPNETLSSYIKQKGTSKISLSKNAFLYAWYTPIIDIQLPLQASLQRILIK